MPCRPSRSSDRDREIVISNKLHGKEEEEEEEEEEKKRGSN